jgi:hypothetical protein
MVFDRDAVTGGGHVDDGRFSTRCATRKKISCSACLFEGFRNELFPNEFFRDTRAVENCARGKRMNRRSQKSFPLAAGASQKDLYGRKIFLRGGNLPFNARANQPMKQFSQHARKLLQTQAQTAICGFACQNLFPDSPDAFTNR